MAFRTIYEIGDPLLRKVCKPVKEVTPHIKELVQDLFDTMYHADGVGLAAPQVGILKRLCVVDVGENPIVLINPELLEESGEQEDKEGCLSVPGKYGIVKRAERVKIRAFNEHMESRILEAEGLEARALLHEMDHLNGRLYTDIATELYDSEETE